MRHLQTNLHFLLINLIVVSSDKVTVQPSSTNNPFSAWVTWPQSTNKVAVTIQCPNFLPKVVLKTLDGFDLGTVAFTGPTYWKQLVVHCKEGGAKDWFGGNRLKFWTWRWGMCRSGSSETFIIEWTTVRLKITRWDNVEVFSRNWAATDGKCLLKAGFWRLQNYGTTVVSAKSVLGIVICYIYS